MNLKSGYNKGGRAECSLLSIIIINWNSKDYVKNCLASIYNSTNCPTFECIVVDGASFDGCEEMLTAEYREVRYVQSHENIGFGKLNNLGFAQSNGNIVLLLNPDTIVEPLAISALVDTLQSNPKSGIIGAQLLNRDGSLQTSSVQAFPTPINQALDSNFLRRIHPKSKLWKTYDAYSSNIPTKVEAISGACMMMRRETYQQVNGFTPNYFMYAEDIDISYKVDRLGLNNIYNPASRITHFGGGSTIKEKSLFSTTMQLTSLKTYFELNNSTNAHQAYRVLMFLSGVLRLTILWLLHLSSTGKRQRKQIRISIAKWSAIINWTIQYEKKQ
jgi:GT2 family glycosyltransferase